MKDEEIAQAMYDTLVKAGLDEETAIKAVLYSLLHALYHGNEFHVHASAKDLLRTGFLWHRTPEGIRFWSDVEDSL